MIADRALIKARRARLLQIYQDHDVAGFRAFLHDIVVLERPEVIIYVTKNNEELSTLLHMAKAQLLYLGDDWQASRNLLRNRQFYGDEHSCEGKPLCVTCEYFRTAPTEAEEPCMHLGSTPEDICCPGYKKAI
jgi:hypothetical protein